MQMNGYPPGPAPRVSREELPLIRVTGEGQLEAPPDAVEVSLGFRVRTDEAAEAYRQTAAAISQVVQALVEMGVPREQMQSEQISLQPVYDRERLVGYEGSATLRVRLFDPAAAGPVIDRAVAAGATVVQGVRFDLRDPRPYEATAYGMAVEQAHRTAMMLAQAMGVGLGPVVQAVTEPAPGPIVPMGRAVAFEAMPVLPGTLTVSRRVAVDYLIRYA